MPQEALRFTTLTPIWTGGVQETSDRLHETGVLGSMRWWYEAILRGLGGKVHDPTEHKSSLDYKKYKELEGLPDERERLLQSGLCDASQVFGATGWKRRFSLRIDDRTREDGYTRISVSPDRAYVNQHGERITPTWPLKGRPRQGEFSIQIDARPDFKPEVAAGLLAFIARWGALGAKAQMGFGVVELLDPVDMTPFLNWCKTRGVEKHALYAAEPGLHNLFFARIAPHSPSNQTTFNLRHDIRRLFAGNRGQRHFVCGSIQGGNRTATKVKISLPYNGQMAVWGWIPDAVEQYGRSRDQTVQVIHDLLTHHNLNTWREFNSQRDTVRRIHDRYQYLESLAHKEGI